MRQAGRYLPEYRRVRDSVSGFMELCTTPELCCEVALQPLRRYDLDAAILFSDILTIPQALGLEVHFDPGPVLARPVRNRAAVERLPELDLERLNYMFEALRLTRCELDGRVPLIGFCGSPWTLAAYAVEGRGAPGFPRTLALAHSDPPLLDALLARLATAVAACLQAQVEAGAQVLQIFDSWGGLLNEAAWRRFSLQPLQQILSELRVEVPLILFTRGGCQWLELMADAGVDALGLDWECDLHQARARVGNRVALQGNLNPQALLLPDTELREQVQAVLSSYGAGPGHIFNLGHGITPDINPLKLEVLIAAVRSWNPAA